MGKTWNKVDAGIIKAAEQRFWLALGEHAEGVAERLGNDDQSWYLNLLMQTAIKHHMRALNAETVARAKKQQQQRLGTYNVADCFRSKLFAPNGRDGDLDKRLPATLPNLPAGKPTHLVTNESETFRQMAERALDIVGQNKTDAEIQGLLVEKGKTFSLKQIDEAVTRHAAGDKSFGLVDDNRANFFFVEGEGGAVFVVRVRLGSGGWYVYVDRFDGRGWYAGYRVFFRN